MKTLDQIEAELRDGDLAFYAAKCCWWTTNRNDLGSLDGTAHGLPCCPYCGSVLFQGDARKFIDAAKGNASRYRGGAGYEGVLVAFAMSHHANDHHGYGFDKLEPARRWRFPRPPRKLSTEKSMRCVRCRSEFSEADTAGHSACPKCGATGSPMAIKQDVTVNVNWHELRILTMWAERWAGAIEKKLGEQEEPDAKLVVTAIARALELQHPTLAPLTLLGELKQVQESYPEVEVTDGQGNVILPSRKAN